MKYVKKFESFQDALCLEIKEEEWNEKVGYDSGDTFNCEQFTESELDKLNELFPELKLNKEYPFILNGDDFSITKLKDEWFYI